MAISWMLFSLSSTVEKTKATVECAAEWGYSASLDSE